MTEKHETVDEVRADETRSASDEDAFTGRRGQQFYGRETGQRRVGDGLRIGVVNRLGLIIGSLGEQSILCDFMRQIVGGQDVVWTQIEGTEDV
jgi:hypothetical protein